MKLLLALPIVCLLPSCAYTGDPSEGGLFGYSNSMFQDRANQKRGVINSIESDTARQRAEAARLQRRIDGN